MGPDQVLVISPSNSLIFEGTFKEVITKKIIMTNPLDKNVAFKIKTTTPKQYCVRPNIGYIAPEQSKEISIMLQPLQYTLSEKAKHKFMIQSMVISDEDVANIDAVWKNASVNEIMCSKLLSVLIQTNEIATAQIIKDKPENNTDHGTDDMVSFNDSQDHMPEEESVKEVVQSGDFVNGDTAEHDRSPLSDVLDENCKLREQVDTLKKMVFENTYKWESMQTELSSADTDRCEPEPVYDHSAMKDSIALPMVVYQLIAFFLGLIIGKFLL